MIAKHVLCNVISVASDNTCVYVFRNTSWYHKIYSSFSYCWLVWSQEMFVYTTRRYAEVYENFSIDPASCEKNPIKQIKLSYQIASPY